MIFLLTFSAKFKFLNVIGVIGCFQLQPSNKHVAIAGQRLLSEHYRLLEIRFNKYCLVEIVTQAYINPFYQVLKNIFSKDSVY